MLLKAIFATQQTSLKGILYGWGDNSYGTLGDGTTVRKSTPIAVSSPGLSWKQISSFSTNSGGIKSDGSLWVWGSNSVGQLGLGYQSGKFSTPIVKTSDTTWTSIATASHTLAIKSDGTLWAWGNNGSGELGILSTATQVSPVLVSGPSGASWLAVACGQSSSFGITTEGRLYAWGYNADGQLGDLTTTAKSSPVLVSGPASTSWSVVDSSRFTLGITTTGRLYAWGINDYGQLGDLTITNKSSPILVSGPATTSWSVIATGNQHSMAITSLGRLYAWGINQFYYTLGDLSAVDKSSPVLVSGPANTSWSAIACGALHSLGITTIGRLYSWGYNNFGALGNSTLANASSPVLVSGPASTSWISVSGGNYNSYGVTTLGRLYAWGYNNAAELGDNTTVNKSSPVLVSGPASTSWSVVKSGEGYQTGLAVATNGSVYMWGLNTSEQITGIGVSSPLQLGSSSWTFVSANSSYFGITTQGQLYAWGSNFYGQLGDLTTVDKYSPILVSGPASTSWTSVAGGTTAFGISQTGRLYAWGYGAGGELGDLTTINKSSPILVSGPASTSWSVVSIGLAITTQGRLYSWGNNFYGQLGDLTSVNKSSPILVSGPSATSWVFVQLGGPANGTVLGITSQGRLYAWGNGQQGVLGNLGTSNVSSPVLVSGPAGASWTTASTGTASLAITTQGRLYAWGNGLSGNIGDNTLVSKSSPVLVSGPASTSWIFVAAGLTSLAVTSLT